MNWVNRKLFRVGKYLVLGFVVYIVSWLACVGEWGGGGWSEGTQEPPVDSSTMRTIVAYSEGKQAELDRPSPVTCEELPAFPDVPYINRTWVRGQAQDGLSSWQVVAGTGVALYAAYYDTRLPAQPYVRILARFKGRKYKNEPQLYCQTRPQDRTSSTVEVVAAKPLEIWWHEWDALSAAVETPLLLSCALTGPLLTPALVSVVTQPCLDPANAFLLDPAPHTHVYDRNFTVCVKDMHFDNYESQHLVEWIEVNKILGAEKIDVYVDKVSVSIEDILDHYRKEGIVRIFPVPINHDDRSLWQRRRDHIVTYNDCLYRNIRESRFIVPIDLDEVMLPKIVNDWNELISRLKDRGWNSSLHSAILVKNVFFFNFMQDNKYKSENEVPDTDKLYTKRDDVRLNDYSEFVYVNNDSHYLVGGVGKDSGRLSNQVIDIKDSEEGSLEESLSQYRERCAGDMPAVRLARHVVRSALVSPVGHYSKSLMLTRGVLTAFNHYPLASLGVTGFGGWPAPFDEVQLNHYKEACNATVVWECARYGRRTRTDRAALRLRARLLQALARAPCTNSSSQR